MQILPPLYLHTESNQRAGGEGLGKRVLSTLVSCDCPVAVSVIFRLSRLNMLLSWPVVEDVGVVVGGLGGGDCGEGPCSC